MRDSAPLHQSTQPHPLTHKSTSSTFSSSTIEPLKSPLSGTKTEIISQVKISLANILLGVLGNGDRGDRGATRPRAISCGSPTLEEFSWLMTKGIGRNGSPRVETTKKKENFRHRVKNLANDIIDGIIEYYSFMDLSCLIVFLEYCYKYFHKGRFGEKHNLKSKFR